MAEYTEQQIRELSGRELWIAVLQIVQGRRVFFDVETNDYVYVSDSGFMEDVGDGLPSLDVCVPLLMGEGKVLGGCSLKWCKARDAWQIVVLAGRYFNWVESDDPATAICRAACLVKLREGE